MHARRGDGVAEEPEGDLPVFFCCNVFSVRVRCLRCVGARAKRLGARLHLRPICPSKKNANIALGAAPRRRRCRRRAGGGGCKKKAARNSLAAPSEDKAPHRHKDPHRVNGVQEALRHASDFLLIKSREQEGKYEVFARPLRYKYAAGASRACA